MVGSLISMVADGQDHVLGSSDLSRKRDELKEKCETLERDNSEAEKELPNLQTKVKFADSLREEVDWYAFQSTLAT